VRVTGRLFAGIAFFFGLVGIVYWWLAGEPAGAAALIFTGGLGFLIAVYFLFTAKRIEPLPEDDEEGEIAEGAGEYGFFSPHSWWPLVIGLGAAVTALGLVYLAWWMILLGVVVLMSGVTGLLFEYYRGEFVRE
jgi:hypothetical protein